MYWDAWDVDVYHLEKRVPVVASEVDSNKLLQVLERGPLRAKIGITLKVGESSVLKQVISLTALSAILEFELEVDWHESHQFLKVEFPLEIRSLHATYEIQYGHFQRPTHWNTSWDVAKFEVCAHKWVDFSESGYGVALLNDSKYGHSVHGNLLRLSLLRSRELSFLIIFIFEKFICKESRT
jgi:alpha-mannosidase